MSFSKRTSTEKVTDQSFLNIFGCKLYPLKFILQFMGHSRQGPMRFWLILDCTKAHSQSVNLPIGKFNLLGSSKYKGKRNAQHIPPFYQTFVRWTWFRQFPLKSLSNRSLKQYFYRQNAVSAI